MGSIKGSDYCYVGDLGLMSDLKKKTHLTGCIDEIIGFHTSADQQYDVRGFPNFI